MGSLACSLWAYWILLALRTSVPHDPIIIELMVVTYHTCYTVLYPLIKWSVWVIMTGYYFFNLFESLISNLGCQNCIMLSSSICFKYLPIGIYMLPLSRSRVPFSCTFWDDFDMQWAGLLALPLAAKCIDFSMITDTNQSVSFVRVIASNSMYLNASE